MGYDQSKLDDSNSQLSRAQAIVSKMRSAKQAGFMDVDGNPDLSIPLGIPVDVLSLWSDRAQKLIDDTVIAVPSIGTVKDAKDVNPSPIDEPPVK